MARGETSRDRILKAATELAFSEGAAHLSLDAVAARAGVSKGGLLYNFPSKAALMRALVESYLEDFSERLETAAGGSDENLAARYLDLAIADIEEKETASSGLLAALAEDPCLLVPVKTFNRSLLDRLKSGSRDPGSVLVLFLVLEGLRAQNIFGIRILDKEEKRQILDKLAMLVGAA